VKVQDDSLVPTHLGKKMFKPITVMAVFKRLTVPVKTILKVLCFNMYNDPKIKKPRGTKGALYKGSNILQYNFVNNLWSNGGQALYKGGILHVKIRY